MTVDPTDPDVALTDELRHRMTLEQQYVRERRTYEQMISWPADRIRTAEVYVDDVGLAAAIARLCKWIRLVLRTPDIQAPAPLITPRMEERWRACGRDLADLTRYGTAAAYAREVIRDVLGLRGTAKAPGTLNDRHAHELHAVAAATAEHLAGLRNVELPTRRPRAA